MKHLTFLSFILLLCAAFTSCLPEVTLADAIEPEVTVPVTEEPVTNRFTYGTISFKVAQAYLRTVAEGDIFHHTLVLTEDQLVPQNGDLAQFSAGDVVGISFRSTSRSPAGRFNVLNADSSPSDVGVRTAGATPYYDFEQPRRLLTDLTFASGFLNIAIEDGAYRIETDLDGSGFDRNIKGKYAGQVTMLELPEQTPVSLADFTGEVGMTRNAERFELSNAYLREVENSFTYKNVYKLFVTETRADDGNGALTGTTNTALFYLHAKDGIKSGRYALSGSNGASAAGYFASVERSQITNSFLCRGMNFDTNNMLDDEPMDAGEAIVLLEDGTFRIKFSYVSVRGATVKGEYQGSILKAR